LGLAHYPLKRFLDLLRLWYRLTDFDNTQVGPAVAGRLQGRPFTLVTEMTIRKQDGTELTGDAALAHPGEEAGVGGVPPATQSGLQSLIRTLQNKYGTESQDQQAQDIDDFFDLRRGRHSLLEHLIEFDHRYDHARTSSGLTINNIGLAHMLLKHCMVDHQTKAHVRLLVNNDLNRLDDIKGHLQRLAKTASAPGISSNTTYAGDWTDEAAEEWPEETWWPDDSTWDEYEEWSEHDDDDESWEWASAAGDGAVTSQAGSESHQGHDAEDEPWDDAQEAAYGKGKRKGKRRFSKGKSKGYKAKGKSHGKGGKGKGAGKSTDGCSNCGSPWHHASNCPNSTNKKGK